MSVDNDDSQRKENGPDRSEDLTVSSTELVLSQLHQQQNEKLKKKKSRGNRKLQRFRRQLRRQGLNTEAIETLINAYNDSSLSSTLTVNVDDLIELSDQTLQQELLQAKASKRNRETKSKGATTLVSHIAIAQSSTMRQRSTTVTDDIIELNDNANQSKTTLKPKYLKLSDHVLKKMLLNSLEGIENTNELFDTPEKLQYARDYAHLVSNVLYLKLKQDFWENYYQVATTTGVWSLNMSKQVIKENHLRRIRLSKESPRRIETSRQRLKST